MKILFLTNNLLISKRLFDFLKLTEKEVILLENKIKNNEFKNINPDIIISYNYKYIIEKDILKLKENKFINLHISLLPFNRGAYPNVWSFINNTPKGVTIHLINEGLDTGDILYQEEIYFNEDNETLNSSYNKLHNSIQELFIKNWENIKKNNYIQKLQNIEGTLYYKKDFDNKILSLILDKGWDIKISDLKKGIMKSMENKFDIHKYNKTFIIAELSCNHIQDLDIAKETIYAMKESGADAVKLQTYTPDTMTINSDKEYFMIKQNTLWDNMKFYDLYKEAYTPWEWHYELKELAEKLGLIFFSTPFDKSSVDFLEDLNIPIQKIASFEITDIPLIEYTASKMKPIIISTGIATLSDIQDAVNACRKVGNNNIILLKCTSAYPSPFEDMNLKTIPNLAETFNCTVGLSDYSLGISIPIAAVALGAKVIEKHFILSRDLPSHDKEFSLEPQEFKNMVNAIRDTEKALGKVSYDLTEKTKKSREFSRSLFIVEDIKEGEILTEKNIRSIRPGYGLPPKYLNDILGKKARINLEKGTPLDWGFIS